MTNLQNQSHGYGMRTRAVVCSVALLAALGCTRNQEASTTIQQGESVEAIGQVGSPGSTKPSDAATQPDANPTDDLGGGNATGQTKDATVSGTSNAGTNSDSDRLLHAAPRVSDGSTNESGTSITDKAPAGGTRTDESGSVSGTGNVQKKK